MINSLRQKILVISTLLITLFLLLASIVIIEVYSKNLSNRVYLRLDSMMLDILSSVKLNSNNKLVVDLQHVDSKLLKEDTGFYAVILGNNKIVWHSNSTPDDFKYYSNLPAGVERHKFVNIKHEGFYALLHGAAIRDREGDEENYTLMVFESSKIIADERRDFETSFLIGLLIVACFVWVVQYFVLKYNLYPLRKIARDISSVKEADKEFLDVNYPYEIQQLASLVNDLLEMERATKAKYKNSLGDLAHSIKTPLAIMRNNQVLPEEIKEQIAEITSLVEYHLKRASHVEPRIIKKQIKVAKIINRLLNAMQKVYHDKDIVVACDVKSGTVFRGEKEDLVELLGNIIDNAFKWAHKSVRITAYNNSDNNKQLNLIIEDDGPGIKRNKKESITERGVRQDKVVAGYGIGMAIVNDIVTIYNGTLEIERSEQLGGAKIIIQI
jgi:two-component system sensor histidine kinase PhoQ